MKNLPKGLRLDHGYVQVRLMHNGQIYCRNFGKDSDLARELAMIHLSEKRKEILMGQFGIVKDLPQKGFAEVASLYLELWSMETTPNGLPKHTDVAIRNQKWRVERILIPYFGKMWYHEIRPADVQRWRDKRVLTVEGTTANKEQIALSSIYTHIKTWIALEKIKAFKIPEIPFCEGVEQAQIKKRTRLLTTAELSILRSACEQYSDQDLWEIIKLALKSLLRTKDLIHLETGLIDTIQAKTQRPIQLPVTVLRPLNYVNFRKRWEAVRRSANLLDVQFRDLRKTGANLLKLKNHSNKLISEYLGHSNTKTTELYMVQNSDHLKPLASDLEQIVESL